MANYQAKLNLVKQKENRTEMQKQARKKVRNLIAALKMGPRSTAVVLGLAESGDTLGDAIRYEMKDALALVLRLSLKGRLQA